MAIRGVLPTLVKSSEVILAGRRNNQAWFDPVVGVIPAGDAALPHVIVRATFLMGADNGPQFIFRTSDLGKTWTTPILCQNWFKLPLANDVFEEPSFGLFYHAKTRKLLAIGHTHFVQDEVGDRVDIYYKNERRYVSAGLLGSVVCSLWNPGKSDFEPWSKVQLPDHVSLQACHKGQWHENADGSILIPGYHLGALGKADGLQRAGVTVLRFSSDGCNLRYLEHGSVLQSKTGGGLLLPSLVYFQGIYFLTVGHDQGACVATSEDGLHFGELIPWSFDDGAALCCYGTQQKWLPQLGSLYLIYNRKSELSRGVYRDSAPLFMAQVDASALRLIRSAESVVLPERGARMDGFSVARITEKESWVVAGELLQGMFPFSREGDRFWQDPRKSDEASPYNYIRFVGDLLLARVYCG